MEIKKMLIISATHVQESTLELLAEEAEIGLEKTFPGINVYHKGDEGFIIDFAPFNKCSFNEYIRHNDNMPADLKLAIAFAIEAGCNMLCLDDNGEELFCLPHYQNVESVMVDGIHERCYLGDQLIGTKVLDA